VSLIGVAVLSLVLDSHLRSSDVAPKAPQIVLVHPKFAYSLLDAFTLSNQPLGRLAVRIQENITTCMARRGWKYVNVTRILYNDEYTSLQSFWDYRTTFGYGFASDVIEGDTHRLVPSDANFEYLSMLSSARRRAYWIDLIGHNQIASNFRAVPLSLPSSSSRDCESTARRQTLGDLGFFQPSIRFALDAMYREQLQGLAVAQGMRKWQACMDRHGLGVGYFDQEESHFQVLASAATLLQARQDLKPETTAATIDAQCFLQYLYPPERASAAHLLYTFALRHPLYRHKIALTLSKY